MQNYWEERRKKKKGKVNYAMCANEQGAGVRFSLHGGDGKRELPRVRGDVHPPVSSHRAVEEHGGQVPHHLREREVHEYGSAARDAVKGRSASPEARDAFVGAWNGINDRGATIETVIERVDPDGNVAGTRCTGYPNGSFAWSTLDGATFVNGDRITLMNGNVRMTFMMNGAQAKPQRPF